MDFLPKEIEDYALQHTSPEPPLLTALYRETYQKVLRPRMLSGHFQGRVLSMLSHMIRPRFILEIGTYTGYSAICLAEGLASGGKLLTIDINEEIEEIAEKYFQLAGLEKVITRVTGDALELIPSIQEKPDIVFIDADKENYPAYYELLVSKMMPGSYIIADNVLWSGKVVSTPDPKDNDTLQLLKFNARVRNDDRVEEVLLPIRDGLMIIRIK